MRLDYDTAACILMAACVAYSLYLVAVCGFTLPPTIYEDEPGPYAYPDEYEEVCLNEDYLNPPQICLDHD